MLVSELAGHLRWLLRTAISEWRHLSLSPTKLKARMRSLSCMKREPNYAFVKNFCRPETNEAATIRYNRNSALLRARTAALHAASQTRLLPALVPVATKRHSVLNIPCAQLFCPAFGKENKQI